MDEYRETGMMFTAVDMRKIFIGIAAATLLGCFNQP